jgi:hypothetical protein
MGVGSDAESSPFDLGPTPLGVSKDCPKGYCEIHKFLVNYRVAPIKVRGGTNNERPRCGKGENLEFVVVRFEDDRQVFINGRPSGRTGETLRVEEGRQTFNLGNPRNYTPKWRRPLVRDTNPLNPLEVRFEKKT